MAQSVSSPISRLHYSLLAKAFSFALAPNTARVNRIFLLATCRAMQAEWYAWAKMSNQATYYSPERLEEMRKERKEIGDETAKGLNRFYPPADDLFDVWHDMTIARMIMIRIAKTQQQLFSESDPQLYRVMYDRHLQHVRGERDLAIETPVRFHELHARNVAFIAEEGAFLRMRMIAKRGLNPEDPKQIMRCFATLHQRQKESASDTEAGRLAFLRIPRDFSQATQRQIGQLLCQVACDVDVNLRATWVLLRRALMPVAGRPRLPLPEDTPQENANADQIRGWLYQEENQRFLNQIHRLDLSGIDLGITDLSPELTQLRNLSYLNVRVGSLPPFLAECRYLHSLYNQHSRMHTFSDAFYRHLEGDFYPFDNWTCLGNLTEDRFERIPFRMWFKNHLTLPHFWPMDSLNSTLRDSIFYQHYRQYGLFEVCVTFPWLVLTTTLDVLINLPIFLINLFLIDVVEPIVTWARDRMGLDRTVRIQ